MKNNHDFVTHNCDHYVGHRYHDLDHRKYKDDADICIVGAGAAGGVLAYELSKAGFKVVVLEAGPYWNPQTDFASDELSMNSLGWQDTRLSTGQDPISFGHNNSGRGVGGGTVHFTGVFLRFHASDFKVKTLDGVAEDWPITYEDLAPYYDKIERDIAVSGPKEFPWGEFAGPYPYPVREPISANAQLFRRGCERLGIRSVVTPLAILSAPFEGRPPCINRGFCNQGCLPNAKFSTLIHHIPKAIQLGAEVLSDCMVTHLDLNKAGRVSSITFVHAGKEYAQRARVFILASFVVETPRLLLHSACPKFPEGLANSSGLVGKCIMPHSSHDLYAKFDQEVRLYKGTPVLASTQEFYETDPARGFVRGYTLHAHGSRPVAMAKGIATKAGIWGKDLYEIMRDYNYYGRVTLVGEVLPNPANTITLGDEKDAYGIPRAVSTFRYGDNDNKLIAHAMAKAKEIMEAVGGKAAFVTPDSAHLMGGTRMGQEPATSVVDPFCRSHDIANLYICSASVFVTSGGGNPTETVMALAARTADHIIEQAKTRAY
ncbi:GMC family oxidoreductase [Desulfotomaculum sp. 1211_IL3151]|uniref:GMC family oxidoreductase n=1 Tax=Desulfotomaculum sp. 1211_IL3151 TaxID=3084055 RepID=UPI002FDA27BB